jgi:hypothetical protein
MAESKSTHFARLINAKRLSFRYASARMSPEQHEFARAVIAAGGEYHVARSIDDVQKLGL